MALQADANGVLKGKFTIPEKVLAGTKSFNVVGQGGTTGAANFVGQGTLVAEVLQSVTRVTNVYESDPLAQTFTLSTPAQLAGCDLFVTAKGNTPIIVQIRETSVGYPTGVILAEGRIRAADLVVGQWNRFVFDDPVLVPANSERALVVLCNDAVGAVAIAELGKFDSNAQRWVTNQPYQVGVLLSSSNAVTWTAHQDKDLAFQLLARSYTETTREISLGKITANNATDIVVLSMADNVATGADSDLLLTMPDGSTITAGDGQAINLTSPVSGDISVTARLKANGTQSAVMYPGTQVATGTIQTTGEYISRAINADAAGCNIRVIFDAILPSGSSAKVFYCGTDEGDAWTEIPTEAAPVDLGSSVYEYKFKALNIMEAYLRVKIVLTGTAAARPYVFNLRVSIT